MTASKNQPHDTTQETRQMILSVSQTLFMSYGFRSVSTRQIADACGVTQPALYHHFKNKQMIYTEVVREIMNRTKKDLYRIKYQNALFRDRLFQITYYMLMNHQGDLSQMFHDLQHEMTKETQQMIQKWWVESYLNPMVEMIEEAVELEQIRDLTLIKSNATEIAYFFLDIMRSFIQSSTQKNRVDAECKKEAERKSNLLVMVFLEGINGQ